MVLARRKASTASAGADMLQIGSRSMQNFPLLTEAGRSGVPVLLKRGWSATLEEWLCASEYIAMAGNLEQPSAPPSWSVLPSRRGAAAITRRPRGT